MIGKNVVISVSLFAERKDWSLVLGKGIAGVFIEINRLFGHHKYFIGFNRCSGFNIRLSVLCRGTQHAVSEHLQQFFSKLFNDHELEENFRDQGNDGLFLNIPQNTVKFGLFNPVFFLKENELDHLRLKILISRLLEDYFSSRDVDDDSVFLLSLFLELSLICSFVAADACRQQRILDYYDMALENHQACLMLTELFAQKRPFFRELYQCALIGDLTDIFSSSEDAYREILRFGTSNHITIPESFTIFLSRRQRIHLTLDNSPTIKFSVKFIIRNILKDNYNGAQN